MGANTKIEWAHHTFNPWLGCTKVSPACDHCYAEGWAKRAGHPDLWAGNRRRTSEANWRQPIKWNDAAGKLGLRPRVFCASLADVFDNQVPAEWRRDLFDMIYETPNLDWLLLTKRPQNIAKMLPGAIGEVELWPWPNVWLGTTVENQAEAERRIPSLLKAPAAKHFLSCEPLLGPVNLAPFGHVGNNRIVSAIDWVICGGESGPGARPMHPDWARSLRDQCAEAGIAFHFKQWGAFLPGAHSKHWTTVANDGKLLVNDPRLHVERVTRVGKARAGRLLDGIEHNGFPA